MRNEEERSSNSREHVKKLLSFTWCHSYLSVAKSPRIAASLRQEESKAWGCKNLMGNRTIFSESSVIYKNTKKLTIQKINKFSSKVVDMISLKCSAVVKVFFFFNEIMLPWQNRVKSNRLPSVVLLHDVLTPCVSQFWKLMKKRGVSLFDHFS